MANPDNLTAGQRRAVKMGNADLKRDASAKGARSGEHMTARGAKQIKNDKISDHRQALMAAAQRRLAKRPQGPASKRGD